MLVVHEPQLPGYDTCCSHILKLLFWYALVEESIRQPLWAFPGLIVHVYHNLVK